MCLVMQLHPEPCNIHRTAHIFIHTHLHPLTPTQLLFIPQIKSTARPHLPRLGEVGLMGSPEAALLDRQFRLLREDMVAPLREELKALEVVIAGKGHLGLSQRRNTYRLKGVLGINEGLRPRPSVMVCVELPMR